MKRLPLVVTALAIVIGSFISMSASHPRAEAQTDTAVSQPSADTATVLYLRDCGVCHGASGSGTGRGPSLEGVGAASADFMIQTGRMPLKSPTDQAERRKPKYSNSEVDGLVRKVASFGSGPPIPTVSTAGTDLAKGGASFRLSCAGCHGAAGAGGAIVAGSTGGRLDHAPALNQATAVQTVEAMRVGPGNMPQFSVARVSDADAANIAGYVEALHHPDDRGGWGLGHLGPVAEGAIGLFVGVGLLVWVTHRIGTSST